MSQLLLGKVNKLAVTSMGLRVHEVAVTLTELLPAAVAANQAWPSHSLSVQTLATTDSLPSSLTTHSSSLPLYSVRISR